MASIATINVDLVAKSAGFARGIDEARNRVKLLDRDTGSAARGVARSSESMTTSVAKIAAGVGTAVAAYRSLSSVASVAVDSVRLASEAEKTAGAFEVMVGSAKEATALLARLRQFAASSPFTFQTSSDIGKQLLAAGIEADQIVPTLRMLGDLAVGDSEKLGRLAYAYGQVRAANRLYGTELRQFTETGIPVVPAIADAFKRPTADVKELVEEGKVGFTDLQRSLVSLTAEGGRFHGMTERYGRTFGGMIEQLQDAIQVTKAEFGRAIIEEMGLKDAARDLTQYTTRIREHVAELRPAIRFTGDLARGVVQVSYEFSKAAMWLGRMELDAIGTAVPEVRELAASISQIVADLKNFELDPVEVTRFGFLFTRALIAGLGLARNYLVDMGLDARKHFVDPFLEAAKAVKDVATDIQTVIERVRELQGKPPIEVDARPPAMVANLKQLDERLAALNAAEARARMAAMDRFAGLTLEQQPADVRAVGVLAFAQQEGAKARAALEAQFNAVDTAAGRPPMFNRADIRPKDVRAGILDAAGVLLGTAGAHAPSKAVMVDPMADLPPVLRKLMQYESEWLDRAKELKGAWSADRAARNRDRAGDVLSQSFLTAAAARGGAFDSLGLAARGAAAALDQVRISGGIAASVLDAAKQATQQFGPLANPLTKFKNDVTDLVLARGLGRLDRDTYNAALADRFRDLGGTFGEHRLAPAAEYGTAEFTKAAMQAFTPRAGNDPATLLQAIKVILEQTKADNAQLAPKIVEGLQNAMGPVKDMRP